MVDDSLHYDHMVDAAMRSVMRDSLHVAAQYGLPGEHHFYIGFLTHGDGAQIPAHLKAQYPEEMTIVIQHKFWNLDVGEDAFSIELTFDGRPQALHIPYAAVTRFVDPSVNFGLQFQQEIANPGMASNADEQLGQEQPKLAESATEEPSPQEPATAEPAPEDADTEKPKSENVVSLDTFRDKK